MKFVICGTVVPTKFETEIKALSNAGNRFLTNFCKSLSYKNDLKVLSFISVPVEAGVMEAVNQEKVLFETDYFFSHKKRIKTVFQYIRAVKKAIRNAECIITYNAVYAWFCAPYFAKFMKKKSLLLLADYSPANSYQSVFRKIYAYIGLKVIQRYTYVIGLSLNTKTYLKRGQKFICIEGGIDREFYNYFDKPTCSSDGITKFMYAGLLEKVTGIEQLLQAFMLLNRKDVRLMISGKGALQKLIEESEKTDNRIIYLGCPPYPVYMENLKKADVLVNPRDMKLPENQFNFPSKILEYLATGKRIISTKFPGWEKFAEAITFCENCVEDIKKSLEAACVNESKDEFTEYQRIRDFAEQFIWSEQIDKILKEIERS